MSASLIASQPKHIQITHLYEMALKFIDVTLSAGNTDIGAMQLWNFIAKDYSSKQ